MPITPLSELIPPAIESKDHDICIDPEVDAGSNLKKRKVTDQALTYSNTDALGVSGIDGGALGVSGIKMGDKLRYYYPVRHEDVYRPRLPRPSASAKGR